MSRKKSTIYFVEFRVRFFFFLYFKILPVQTVQLVIDIIIQYTTYSLVRAVTII